MKRTFILVTLLVCLCLSSCAEQDSVVSLIHPDSTLNYGDTGGLALPIDTHRTKINILIVSEHTNLSEKLVIKELSERTGLNINFIAVPEANIQERMRVMLGSNDMPDIVNCPFTVDEINQLGEQGIFVSINKYINELPNLKKTFVDNEKNSVVFDTYTSEDNNLYIVPKFDCERPVNHGFLYRKDIFDKNGIPAWKTTDEFYQALKKLKEIYPTSTPYASKRKKSIFNEWSVGWGISFPGMYFDEETQTFQYSATDPKAKQMLDFMRQLYAERLIDEEFLTCSQDTWETKMIQPETVFTTFDWISRMDLFYQQAGKTNPDYDLRYAYPVGPTGKVVKTSNIGAGPAVTNNGKKLLSLKLLDYLLSPSGAELMTLGVQSKTFQLEKDDSIKYLGFSENQTISIQELQERYGMFIEGLYRRMDKRSIYFSYTPKEQEAQNMIVEENRFAAAAPMVRFDSSQKAQVAKWSKELQSEALLFAENYVLGRNTGEAAWQQWLKKARDLGAQELTDLYNRQYHSK